MGREEKLAHEFIFIVVVGLMALFLLVVVEAADPVGPDNLDVISNVTKAATGAKIINISGGRIAGLNLTATIQNPRWKGFVGWITGKFTLDDAGGSTIYDWTLSSITGRVYATRTSGSVTWSSINCSNVSVLEQENINMNHTNADDNITATFNTSAVTDHDPFWVGSIYINANSCPTLSTYVNNQSQTQGADVFEEMALYDGTNIVYATILEEDETGYNAATYDFQMIVPENGLPDFAGATAYYIYVEIGT